MSGLVRVYVDESGDRGWSAASSPVFLQAALIVPDELDANLRAVRDQLCVDLSKPTHTVLHWAQNIKQHSQRKHVAKVLGSLAPQRGYLGVQLAYVVVDKARCSQDPSGMGNHTRMYNYSFRRLLERVSWRARRMNREALVTIAHVKNFKYPELASYLALLKSRDTSIEWARLRSIKIGDPIHRQLLQLADVAAGALYAAVVPDAYGSVEDSYLAEMEGMIYRNTPGKVTTYGLHVIGGDALLTGLPWWEAFPK